MALLASLACLALVAWQIIASDLGTRSATAPIVAASAEFEQLDARLQEILTRVDEFRSSAARAAETREPVLRPSAVSGVEERIDALKRELQDLRFAVQTVADGVISNAGGSVSHNIAELRRAHRATDWAACEALIQQAMAEPDAGGRSYLDSDKSAVLGSLLMSRPIDLLNRFGSPSRTEIVDGRFVWLFASPIAHATDETHHRLTITFEKGYVWDVEISTP